MKKNIIYSLLASIVGVTAIVGCLPKDHNIYTGPTVIEFKNHTRAVIDYSQNKLGVYSCAAQTDSTRTVNTNSIAFKQKAYPIGSKMLNGQLSTVDVPATTVNVLSCVAAEDGTGLFVATPPVYRLASDPTLAANARGTDSIMVQLVGPQRSTPTVINYTVRPASTAVEGADYNFIPANARTVTIPANSSSAYILVNIPQKAVGAPITSVKLILDLQGASDAAASANYNKFLLTIRKNL